MVAARRRARRRAACCCAARVRGRARSRGRSREARKGRQGGNRARRSGLAEPGSPQGREAGRWPTRRRSRRTCSPAGSASPGCASAGSLPPRRPRAVRAAFSRPLVVRIDGAKIELHPPKLAKAYVKGAVGHAHIGQGRHERPPHRRGARRGRAVRGGPSGAALRRTGEKRDVVAPRRHAAPDEGGRRAQPRPACARRSDRARARRQRPAAARRSHPAAQPDGDRVIARPGDPDQPRAEPALPLPRQRALARASRSRPARRSTRPRPAASTSS